MDDDKVAAIVDHFLGRLDFQNPDEDRAAQGMFFTAMRALPEPDAFVPGPEGEGGGLDPKALLLIGDRLIEVRAYRDDQDRMRVGSVSRPLADWGVVIELEWGDREVVDPGVGYRTDWSFKFADGHSVAVRGHVRTQPNSGVDAREEFARAVAARVGERVGTS